MYSRTLSLILLAGLTGCLGPVDAGGNTDSGTDAGTPKDGGATDAGASGPRIIAPTQSIVCMAGDNQALYWVNSTGTIVRHAAATGVLDTLSGGGGAGATSSCGLAVTSDSLFVARGSSGTGVLDQLALDGGSARFPIVGLQGPNALVADDTYVYPSEAAGTRLRRCAIANPQGNDACTGGDVVSSALSATSHLVQDATSLYFINEGSGQVMRVNKTGGTPTAVFTATSGTDAPVGLALCGTNLVWTSVAGVTHANLDGSNAENYVSDPQGAYANAVATDCSNIYWGDATGLHSVSVRGGTSTLLWGGAQLLAGTFVQLDATSVYWTDTSGNVWAMAK